VHTYSLAARRPLDDRPGKHRDAEPRRHAADDTVDGAEHHVIDDAGSLSDQVLLESLAIVTPGSEDEDFRQRTVLQILANRAV
jgi:hypothetical protein